MADNGSSKKKSASRVKANPQLIVSLACGQSVAEAAKSTGISERTIYRRLQEPEFIAAICDARETLLDQASGELAASMRAAAQTLKGLLESESEKTRLFAAREILSLGVKVRVLINHEARLAEIERAIAEGATA